jgi:methionyl-tRNA formyltransferase
MDDGPILMQSYEPIYSDVTGGMLMDGLAITGGVTLAKALRLMAEGKVPRELPQVEADATFAHKLKKTDGLIDWTNPVLTIERRIRAYSPWPGCYTFLPERFRKKGNSGRLVIVASRFAGKLEAGWKDAEPGTVVKVIPNFVKGDASVVPGPVVKCGDTALVLTQLKPEGAALMDGGAFLRGRPLQVGEKLSMA